MEEIIHLALSLRDELCPRGWSERWRAHLERIGHERSLPVSTPNALAFEELARRIEDHTCRDVSAAASARILVVDGASSTGKSYFGAFLRQQGWVPILRHKDRAPRRGEEDGVDAHFVSQREFTAMMEQGELIAVRGSFGERRGYSRATILRAVQSGTRCFNAEGLSFLPLAAGDPVLTTIPTFSVFLLPPSLEELLTRMVGRVCAGQQFSSGADLVVFLREQKVLERLEYGFNDLSASLEGSDPRRWFLADCYAVHDTPQRVLTRLGII